MNHAFTPKKVFVETYGCPYGAVLHDDFEVPKEDKWLGVNNLEKVLWDQEPYAKEWTIL